MTEEVKTQVDDMKDFAQQAKLEVKMRARDAQLDAEAKVAQAAIAVGVKEPKKTPEQMVVEGAAHTAKKMENARDLSKQVGLEAQKKSRDAKLAFDQSAAGAKINEAARATADAARTAKEGVLDAVLPTEKVVEQTSTRGVDITHVENPRNQRIDEMRAEEAARAAAAADREKEIERQRMLDAAKAKAAKAGEVLSHVADEAAVVLGKAAVAAKEKIDELSAEPQQPAVQPRTSANGIDISAVSNAHNDELLAQEQRKKELAKAAEPTLADKAAQALDKAGAAIKGAFVEATTDAPPPVFVAKQSAAGIDISHVENAANAELLAADEKRAKEQKARELARKKAIVADQVSRGIVQPVQSTAAEGKDELSAKFAELGSSISRAAGKLGAAISEQWEAVTNPVPVDVHEKKSDNGIDTTSISNANNHVLGEQIKKSQAVGGLGSITAPSKSEAIRQAQEPAVTADVAARAAVAPDRETAAIKSGLDGGVAVRDANAAVKLGAQQEAQWLKEEARLMADEANMKAQHAKTEAKIGAAQIKSEVKAVGEKIAEKITEATIAPTAL